MKVKITDELALQVVEATFKTMSAKKQKVISRLAQEERKAVMDLYQFYWEKIFGEPKKPEKKKKAPVTDGEDDKPKDEALLLATCQEPSAGS